MKYKVKHSALCVLILLIFWYRLKVILFTFSKNLNGSPLFVLTADPFQTWSKQSCELLRVCTLCIIIHLCKAYRTVQPATNWACTVFINSGSKRRCYQTQQAVRCFIKVTYCCHLSEVKCLYPVQLPPGWIRQHGHERRHSVDLGDDWWEKLIHKSSTCADGQPFLVLLITQWEGWNMKPYCALFRFFYWRLSFLSCFFKT